MLNNLSFSNFKAYFRVVEPLVLPDYTGSTFRGALGHALREVRYDSGAVCKACPDLSSCRYMDLYSYFFESPWDHPFIKEAHEGLLPMMRRETYPQPFVIDPSPGGQYSRGEILELSFTLIGKAVEHFPFFKCGLANMADRRLGRGGGRVVLEAVCDGFPSEDGNEALVYDGETREIVGPCQVIDFEHIRRWIGDRPGVISEVNINFLTPFRYKYENRSGHPLTFEILMRNLLRRFTLLSVHSPLTFPVDYKQILSLAASVGVKAASLKEQGFERYSARQNSRISMDGAVGEITFAGDMPPFLPFLKMGEFLNVGKNASFGLGKYQVAFTAKGD